MVRAEYKHDIVFRVRHSLLVRTDRFQVKILTGDSFHFVVLFDFFEIFGEFFTEISREHFLKRNEVRLVEQPVIVRNLY